MVDAYGGGERLPARHRFPPHAHPGQFTFVMATGIVSVGLHNTHIAIAAGLSMVMFVAAVAGYLVLIVTVLARWIRPRQAAHDVRGEGFALFAFTAASGVLGAWFSSLHIGWAATVLTVVAAISWAILGYLVLGIAVVRLTGESSARQRISGGRPRGLARVDGTWFLLVVATQSVAVAAGALATADHRPGFALLAAICWCMGLLQLGLIAALMTARLLIVPLTGSDEVAPYWVFMGAGAISVLAGAEILATRDQQTFLDAAFIGSVCMVLWSFATWLIPLLVIMVIWHGLRRDTYAGFRTALWSIVFPVGMYGEASRQLGVMRGIDWLEELGTGEAWIAFAVWLVIASGMLVWWWRWVRGVPAVAGTAVTDEGRHGIALDNE